MTLTPEQLHILQHALGCDKHGRSTSRYPSGDEPYFRNRYVCDPSPLMEGLVAAGLLKDHGSQGDLSGDMHCYTVTPAGIHAMRHQSPPPPRLTRSQQRYQDWQNEDGGERFTEWLVRVERDRKVNRGAGRRS